MAGGYMRESIWAVRVGVSSGWGLLLGSPAGRRGGGLRGRLAEGGAGWGSGGGQSRSAGVVGGEGQGAVLSRVAQAGGRGGGGLSLCGLRN